MLSIKIKYNDKNMPRLKKIDKSDWIDLYLVDIVNLPHDVRYNKEKDGWDIFEGDVLQVNLGISMELPEGYEAIISPRSSLFKRHRLILTNSIGVIDNKYNGNNDIWGAYLYCLKGQSFIKRYERILQFRILQNQPNDIKFQEVERLENKDRGGFGSTGY